MGGIIWLASYPKSGNTWMRAFLHNLLRNPERPANINELDQFCLGDSQAGWYEQVSGRDIKSLSIREIAELRPKVHEAFTRAHPDSVFAKTHNILGSFEGVPLVSMQYTVGAVYVVRNPLDVSISLADHYGISIDEAIEMLGNPDAGSAGDANVYEIYNTWSRHVESWTHQESDSLIWLRYEDMLAKPVKSFGQVARFLRIDPPRQRLDKAIKFSSFKVLRRQEEQSGFRERSSFSERFFRAGRAGQWRKALTPAQVDAVVAAHHAQMERFGYLP